ncbi:hypothetical protein HDV05_000418 [Chytridiales sp. JEL 0842]|nr:hypothetical protein HDV05_000418 [Chytridiales sp. JEL 0842]
MTTTMKTTTMMMMDHDGSTAAAAASSPPAWMINNNTSLLFQGDSLFGINPPAAADTNSLSNDQLPTTHTTTTDDATPHIISNSNINNNNIINNPIVKQGSLSHRQLTRKSKRALLLVRPTCTADILLIRDELMRLERSKGVHTKRGSLSEAFEKTLSSSTSSSKSFFGAGASHASLDPQSSPAEVEAYGHLAFAAVHGHPLLILGTTKKTYLHLPSLTQIHSEQDLAHPCQFSLFFSSSLQPNMKAFNPGSLNSGTTGSKEYRFTCETSPEYLDWFDALRNCFWEVHGFDPIKERQLYASRRQSMVSRRNSISSSRRMSMSSVASRDSSYSVDSTVPRSRSRNSLSNEPSSRRAASRDRSGTPTPPSRRSTSRTRQRPPSRSRSMDMSRVSVDGYEREGRRSISSQGFHHHDEPPRQRSSSRSRNNNTSSSSSRNLERKRSHSATGYRTSTPSRNPERRISRASMIPTSDSELTSPTSSQPFLSTPLLKPLKPISLPNLTSSSDSEPTRPNGKSILKDAPSSPLLLSDTPSSRKESDKEPSTRRPGLSTRTGSLVRFSEYDEAYEIPSLSRTASTSRKGLRAPGDEGSEKVSAAVLGRESVGSGRRRSGSLGERETSASGRSRSGSFRDSTFEKTAPTTTTERKKPPTKKEVKRVVESLFEPEPPTPSLFSFAANNSNNNNNKEYETNTTPSAGLNMTRSTSAPFSSKIKSFFKTPSPSPSSFPPTPVSHHHQQQQQQQQHQKQTYPSPSSPSSYHPAQTQTGLPSLHIPPPPPVLPPRQSSLPGSPVGSQRGGVKSPQISEAEMVEILERFAVAGGNSVSRTGSPVGGKSGGTPVVRSPVGKVEREEDEEDEVPLGLMRR